MFDSVRCAHKKNQPEGWFQCAWLALAVRAGFELMYYIIDNQHFKNILCQG
jgi:hypothetical protein